MEHDSSSNGDRGGSGWLEASGLPHIVRTFGMAVQPGKLGLALAAIAMTFLIGTVLDVIWKGASQGVEADTIGQFLEAHERGQPFSEFDGSHGVFEVWQTHQRACISGLLASSTPGASVIARTSLGTYVQVHSNTSPLDNLANMVLGVWWMCRYHVFYSVLFGLSGLLVWSLAGGAVCRIAAVQFSCSEIPSLKQASTFARQRLFGGFFLAPCFPLSLIALTMAMMFVGGVFMGIPFVGDLFGGLAFSLAILGGFVIAILLVGLFVGGSLFWPAVAVEGSDAFDAFSRSLAYTLYKPWKTVLYAVFTIVFAAVCWLVLNVFTFFALTFTRIVVSFGTAPFGWWGRGADGDLPSKLERIWPLGGPDAFYVSPAWSDLAWYECISAALVAAHVFVVVGLVWSFLASFYFCGSTVIYYLLRRDVDLVDLEDVYLEEEESAESVVAAATEVSLSVDESGSKPGSIKPKGNDSGTTKLRDADSDAGTD